jgi:hypothetical protein
MLQLQGLVVDLNILRLYPVELDGARIEEGNAEIHLRFDVQEVKVLVDKKGELKQGSYDDIVKMAYGKRLEQEVLNCYALILYFSMCFATIVRRLRL